MSDPDLPGLSPPAARPCVSCPYRRDAPAGLWENSEYERLPLYDLPTGRQPPGVFRCHQARDPRKASRVCAGWLHTHNQNPPERALLGLRVAELAGLITWEQAAALARYRTDVPCFATGAAAADWGLNGPIDGRTGALARKIVAKRI